jgi:cytochrome c biogenesis protein CcmG, thiol:disulfide interchange protein DsbE
MNWKRAIIAAATATPVIALLGWGFTRDPGAIKSPLPGREAPTFALSIFAPGQPPLNRPIGDTVHLADFRGQVVVLNFWASWCLACRDEHTTISAVARSYAGRPVHFFGLLYNDRQPPALEWISEMGGQSYPSVDDPGARTAIDYGVYGVPETYFIDGSGRVAYKYTGPVPAVVLTRVIDSLMAAAPAAPSPQKSGP